MIIKKIVLPQPWYWSDDDLTIQLKKEIAVNHSLYNIVLMTLARRQDNDDVLYELADGRFAVVHLTWGTSNNSDWPRFKIYNNWQEVYAHIIKDAEEFIL